MSPAPGCTLLLPEVVLFHGTFMAFPISRSPLHDPSRDIFPHIPVVTVAHNSVS